MCSRAPPHARFCARSVSIVRKTPKEHPNFNNHFESIMLERMLRPVSRCASALPAQSVWTHFTPLAMRHNAVNLGQGDGISLVSFEYVMLIIKKKIGFPSFEPPKLVLDALHDATARNVVQYTRSQVILRSKIK